MKKHNPTTEPIIEKASTIKKTASYSILFTVIVTIFSAAAALFYSFVLNTSPDGTHSNNITTVEKLTNAIQMFEKIKHVVTLIASTTALQYGGLPIYGSSRGTVPDPCARERYFVIQDDDVLTALMEATNFYRSLHGAQPLSYSSELSRRSQSWANKLAENDKNYHSNPGFGEILYNTTSHSGWPLKRISSNAVETWYKEKNDYKPFFRIEFPASQMKVFQNIGDFTQLVWKKSRQIGVGLAANNITGNIYIVCHFFPYGNIKGQFLKNVQQFAREIN